jgi:hypothetical protein
MLGAVGNLTVPVALMVPAAMLEVVINPTVRAAYTAPETMLGAVGSPMVQVAITVQARMPVAHVNQTGLAVTTAISPH